MKKVKFLRQTVVVAFLVAAISFTGCKKDKDPVKVSGVSQNNPTLTLDVGATETLVVTVTPDNAENKAVTWKSDNTGVATVDTEGKVIAVKAGTVTITATTNDGSKSTEYTITVNERITMSTTKSGEVSIALAGIGEAVIDWGDVSTSETVMLSAYDGRFTEHSHTFSGATSRTIAIDGQNITYLNCYNLQLTALDVTKNTTLTELRCYNNQLTNLDATKKHCVGKTIL